MKREDRRYLRMLAGFAAGAVLGTLGGIVAGLGIDEAVILAAIAAPVAMWACRR